MCNADFFSSHLRIFYILLRCIIKKNKELTYAFIYLYMLKLLIENPKLLCNEFFKESKSHLNMQKFNVNTA